MRQHKERTATHRRVGNTFFLLFLGVWALGFGTLHGREDPDRVFQEPIFFSDTFETDMDGYCRGQRGFTNTLSSCRSFLFSPYGSRRDLTSEFRREPLNRTRLRTSIRGFGNWTTPDDQSTIYSNLKIRSYGVAVGVDQQFGRRFLLGASAGGNWSSLNWNNNGRSSRLKGRISAVHGSIYGRTTLQRFFFDVEAGIGSSEDPLSSKSAFQWNINAEAGTWWEEGLGRIEPFVSIRHASLDLDPKSESKTTLSAGFRYSWKTTGIYATTSPRLYIGVLQELGDRNLIETATFANVPTVYSIPGYQIDETRLFCGGGFTSSMGSSLDLFLRYTAELASRFTSHTVLFGMNWNF